MERLHCQEEAIEFITEEFYELYQLSTSHTVSCVYEILDKTKILDLLKSQRASLKEIQSNLHLPHETTKTLLWLLSFAAQHGVLDRNEKDQFSFSKDPDLSSSELSDKIFALGDSFKISVDYINYVAEKYPSVLKGKIKGVEVLFSGYGKELWTQYFNNSFQGYKVFNLLGAKAVVNALPVKDGIKILELGGGTAGAAQILIHEIKKNGFLKKLGQYMFTDVSPAFLRSGNLVLMNEADSSQYTLTKINFDESLVSQGIKRNSMDIIYGVNSLHVAKDILKTLYYVKDAVVEGGKVVVSELIRSEPKRMLFQEIIFSLLNQYNDVLLNDEYRPTCGFLSSENWRRVFKAAGFKNIESLCNDTNYPQGERFAEVIVGEK